jgi:glutamyl-tRNA synthetase/glutamyl-Q tRNA(Asp) synthetase
MPPALTAHSISGADIPRRRVWCDDLERRLPSTAWRTRFAPAPTGHLHLGHLVNAVYVWGIARRFGGAVILRIEDHDRSRCRPEYEQSVLDDLDWLGFEADIAPTRSYRDADAPGALRQSDRDAVYLDALAMLAERELVYACQCTRRDVAQHVPHATGEEPRYPGTCRGRGIESRETSARRVVLGAGQESFDDLRLGAVSDDPDAQCGDMLVRDRAGNWTYQFAVTVDDWTQDVSLVVRGEDLLRSTARQQRLARLLGRQRLPQYLHHPLLVHPDGLKLSKANGDTALRERRAAGARPEQLIGEAAHLCGLLDAPMSLSASDVAALFASR